MARYEHLPIYKKGMELTIYFEKIVRSFSRYRKHSLGSELRQKSREVVGSITKANSTIERLKLLLEWGEKLEGLMVLIRICKEVKAFSHFINSYTYAANLLVELSGQNKGWIKSQREGHITPAYDRLGI
jgi:hypothetical protein